MTQSSESETIEVPKRAAVIGASLLKKNAGAYYQKNLTRYADELHACARQLNEETDTDWKDLDAVQL